jgi:hypothetical protein
MASPKELAILSCFAARAGIHGAENLGLLSPRKCHLALYPNVAQKLPSRKPQNTLADGAPQALAFI